MSLLRDPVTVAGALLDGAARTKDLHPLNTYDSHSGLATVNKRNPDNSVRPPRDDVAIVERVD